MTPLLSFKAIYTDRAYVYITFNSHKNLLWYVPDLSLFYVMNYQNDAYFVVVVLSAVAAVVIATTVKCYH